jgi:hypothetical protein
MTNSDTNSDSFWINDPLILMDKNKITELWPKEGMRFDDKLNAISRVVLMMSLGALLVTKNFIFFVIGFISVSAVVLVYYLKKKNKLPLKNSGDGDGGGGDKEGFSNIDKLNKNKGINRVAKKLDKDRIMPSKKNPLMNIMLPEIQDNPKRHAAAMCDEDGVEKKINDATKKFVNKEKIFSNLGDSYMFDNSMRSFHAMPNTKIPNDQGAFADFCYGNMPSCKEGDTDMCEKKNFRYTNY